MNQRQPRIPDKAHLEFLRGLPCIICQDNTSTEACHIRMSDARVEKVNPGVAAKPSDKWALPMCGRHHRAQHTAGDERQFWQDLNLDAIFIAQQLYAVSGDHEAGCRVVEKQQAEVLGDR